MAKKLSAWKTKGMNRDLSVSAFNPEFAFENRNLRLSTNEGNTQMSWVNEKGTAEISLDNPIEGTPIGTAIINHQLVLFTSDNENEKGSGNDRIYKLRYNSTKTGMECTLLYNKSLNFCILNPIETLVSYESEDVQKVYWVDGRNQPRMVNICKDVSGVAPTYFDFVNELALKEIVTVEKVIGASGMFAPGVIQYSFTYYNKNGQETNIFYTTPLLYISYKDRGASPEDKVENAFRITIDKVDDRFDYIRIYSIQRTSINGTPICKRIQDISTKELNGNKASYIDTGTSGNSVDPTELLYKGGEAITASTLEQKDNTLFFGGITIKRDYDFISTLQNRLYKPSGISQSIRSFFPMKVSEGTYNYANQLTSFKADSNGYKTTETVPCGGFKCGDVYRCGVQFQDKTGRWSNPFWVGDSNPIGARPTAVGDKITVPTLKFTISDAVLLGDLVNADYVNARAVVVYPDIMDRLTLCQGVLSQTLHTENSAYYQSSWFFRPTIHEAQSPETDTNSIIHYDRGHGGIGNIYETGTVSPTDGSAYGTSNDPYLCYTERNVENDKPDTGQEVYNPKYLRAVEIQGYYNSENRFKADKNIVTLHSPDIEFDEYLKVADYADVKYKQAGFVRFTNTLSDIDIQTETPTIGPSGTGFLHKTFKDKNSWGIVSGLFYDDWILNDDADDDSKIKKHPDYKSSSKYLVYPWQKNGSLNHDINRPEGTGVQSAKLKKKVISNLRIADTKFDEVSSTGGISCLPKLFSSDETSIEKIFYTETNNNSIVDKMYMGNIDTLLTPDKADGTYLANTPLKSSKYWEHYPPQSDQPGKLIISEGETDFTSSDWAKTFSMDNETAEDEGVYSYNGSIWERADGRPGEVYLELILKKEPVRMKYKSTPHMVFKAGNGIQWSSSGDLENFVLPIVEIKRDISSVPQMFGGNTKDALRENTWIPCGEPVSLIDDNGNTKSSVTVNYDYGDTYYQRWDCMKTYAFTPEDINQVVEIGSFMLETRVNIDGRYDRNRGQLSNLNMSPRNFNLMNPIYSQVNNFFSYKILPDDVYDSNEFPNQITWTKTKESGADVDLWTNITLSSVLELDGDKGKVNELIRFNDQLLAFQDTGISQVLYNENVQIQSTDGVPIEIANSGKVQGKRYLSNTVGCSNKWSMIQTPLGIYFMDNNEKAIYLFNGQLNNVSVAQGFNSWSKRNIPSANTGWNPTFPLVSQKSDFTAFYDRLNQDVLFVNKDTALAFSEKFGTFTSFYDYGDTPFFENLDDTGIWIRRDHRLWMHRGSDNYCKFFGENKPYSMILVGNPEPQQDCIFTNIEFRACVDGEGMNGTPTVLNVFDGTFDNTFRFTAPQPVDDKYRPFFPFDYLETWNEYQHGLAYLKDRDGHDWFKHHTNDMIGTLKRKFRMWRCDIPRDNYAGSGDVFDSSFDKTFKGKKRKTRPMDRMRNPWLYIKLVKNLDNTGRSLPRAEIHDFIMTYYV